ncbi:MAG TPA: SPFH domain-containing protein [Candidatus Acidoferrales bacterium]|nr:SPFH domain-containing protein [Candidatus Acidoferrales bacterium]
MLFIRVILLAAGFVAIAIAAGLLAYDFFVALELDRLLRRFFPKAAPEAEEPPRPLRPRRAIHWQPAAKLAAQGVLPILIALSIVVIPDGYAGVRISQISGVLPTTLYSGMHFVVPFIQHISTYDIRDQMYCTAADEESRKNNSVLKVEAQEGLPIGLAVSVRYRLDPGRLAYIDANLPRPSGSDANLSREQGVSQFIVGPIVESAFREAAPDYEVRDIFASKRIEFRQRVAQAVAARLAQDAIDVKEVLVQRIVLPPEYAQGLESLLLKEQESERMNFEQEIQQKQVKVAEYQAEANKVRFVKQAEANAQSRVIAAKAESDAMQFTLPLKQKEIEQARLEAAARKEATLENARADAQAKVIDSQAEQQRQELLAKAEADRILVTGQAEAKQLQLEAASLRGNPLLIQKIVAERLSDKVRIMMVPMDGKFFFTNGVLDGAFAPSDPPAKAGDPRGGNQ